MTDKKYDSIQDLAELTPLDSQLSNLNAILA